jgi:peptidoglycan/LPS O-acetylase OafA/YrhL
LDTTGSGFRSGHLFVYSPDIPSLGLFIKSLTMTDQKIPSLDGLRAVSILLVLIGHTLKGDPMWSSQYEGIRIYASVGVTMFFVISGFLITTLLLKEKASNACVDIRKFYIRRVLRIIPVNFLYIIAVFLLNRPLGLGVETSAFWPAFTYTVNFAAVPVILGHLWSLSVEEQFYLFWPLIMRFPLSQIIIVTLAIIVYGPVVRVINYFFPTFEVVTLMPFFKYADSLMIGCLLAISKQVWPHCWVPSLLRNRIVKAGAVVLILFIPFLDRIKGHHVGYLTTPFGRTIISFSIAYLIASAITIKDNNTYKLLNHPVMVYIGTLSYSIYIWQQFFLLSQAAYWPVWARFFPVNVMLVIVVSMASYYWWEKRFLSLKENFKMT